MRLQKINVLNILLLVFSFLFSFWLMTKTLGYDVKNHVIKIDAKLWSDFGAHIPLVRSFSLGDNTERFFSGQPVEHPGFPGIPIRYHYGFYMISGLLERLGVRIDWALNIPSIIGLALLLFLIYKVGEAVFASKIVGVLGVIFFIFNGTLSFLKFFAKHPLSWSTPNDIITNFRFPSFGPWDGGPVTAFWTLNIYTNQRHTALSFAMVLLVIYIVNKLLPIENPNNISLFSRIYNAVWCSLLSTVTTLNKLVFHKQITTGFDGCGKSEHRTKRLIKNIIVKIFPFKQKSRLILRSSVFLHLALIISSLLFINQAAALIAILILAWVFIIGPKTRLPIILAAIITLPWFIYLQSLSDPSGMPFVKLGYLAKEPLTVYNVIYFWIHNLGLHMLLIPLGMIFAPKRARKLLIIPVIALFTLPNIIQFSPDMINNHKFFNFALILGSYFTAYFIINFFILINKQKIIFKIPLYCILTTVYFLLTFSGLIDFIAVARAEPGGIGDISDNDIAVWIFKNAPKDAVFLNSNWFYHPANMAGRKIFSGYPYFTWSYGYDKDKREKEAQSIYNAISLNTACVNARKYNIDYIELTPKPEYSPLNIYLWDSVIPSYISENNNMRIYEVKKICK